MKYEWKPQYCEKCQKAGHVCHIVKKPTVKMWQKRIGKAQVDLKKKIPTQPDMDKEDKLEENATSETEKTLAPDG